MSNPKRHLYNPKLSTCLTVNIMEFETTFIHLSVLHLLMHVQNNLMFRNKYVEWPCLY